MEEGPHSLWCFLNESKVRNYFALHFLNAGDCFASQRIILEIVPDILVRVEFRRIRRKEKQFHAVRNAFQELADLLRLMRGVAIDSQQTTGYKPVVCILRTVSAVPAEAGSKPPAQAGSMRLEVPSINHLEVLLTLTMLLNIRRNHFVRNIARAACKISPRPHPLPPVLLPKQPIFPLQLVGRLPELWSNLVYGMVRRRSCCRRSRCSLRLHL